MRMKLIREILAINYRRDEVLLETLKRVDDNNLISLAITLGIDTDKVLNENKHYEDVYKHNHGVK